ncbi:MAG: hypothetical protein HC897_10100, partial [Thermoanaerobaculia bacterium]|nr:hypothetical protein [Thermoanaerobaculia bacterium]
RRQNVVSPREGCWLITDTASAILISPRCGGERAGHAHPRLVAALKDQAERLWHTSNLYRVAGQERLAERLALPSGYYFDLGGKVEHQARALRSLLLAIAVALFAVLVLLYLALDSFAEALVILATLPDAFVGGIVALWLAGETWNVSSLVGLIGLFGIAVQNGLVLVTQTRALHAQGHPFEQALREAAIGRLRPKLLTAATAILGLLPLLVLDLHGAEIERPLAIVMTGGLVTSMLFTLLALPSFYSWVVGWRGRPAGSGSARVAGGNL